MSVAAPESDELMNSGTGIHHYPLSPRRYDAMMRGTCRLLEVRAGDLVQTGDWIEFGQTNQGADICPTMNSVGEWPTWWRDAAKCYLRVGFILIGSDLSHHGIKPGWGVAQMRSEVFPMEDDGNWEKHSEHCWTRGVSYLCGPNDQTEKGVMSFSPTKRLWWLNDNTVLNDVDLYPRQPMWAQFEQADATPVDPQTLGPRPTHTESVILRGSTAQQAIGRVRRPRNPETPPTPQAAPDNNQSISAPYYDANGHPLHIGDRVTYAGEQMNAQGQRRRGALARITGFGSSPQTVQIVFALGQGDSDRDVGYCPPSDLIWADVEPNRSAEASRAETSRRDVVTISAATRIGFEEEYPPLEIGQLVWFVGDYQRFGGREGRIRGVLPSVPPNTGREQIHVEHSENADSELMVTVTQRQFLRVESPALNSVVSDGSYDVARAPVIGDRVRWVAGGTPIPVGTLGTVIAVALTTYSVAVDGFYLTTAMPGSIRVQDYSRDGNRVVAMTGLYDAPLTMGARVRFAEPEIRDRTYNALGVITSFQNGDTVMVRFDGTLSSVSCRAMQLTSAHLDGSGRPADEAVGADHNGFPLHRGDRVRFDGTSVHNIRGLEALVLGEDGDYVRLDFNACNPDLGNNANTVSVSCTRSSLTVLSPAAAATAREILRGAEWASGGVSAITDSSGRVIGGSE